MKISIKERPALFFAGAAIFLSFVVLYAPFHERKEELAAQIKLKAIQWGKAKELVSHKDKIDEAYSLIESQNTSQTSDWVKKMTELSKQEGVVFDSLVPDAESVVLRFHTDLGRFAGFTQQLASSDYFSLIESVRLEKAADGLLDCELTVKRVFP